MSYHVLSVDTDLQIQHLRREMLESAGYRVTLAGSHPEVVLATDDSCFDVAILGESLTNDEADRIEHAISVISPTTAVLRQRPISLRLVEDTPEVLLQLVRACIARNRKQRVVYVRRAG